jgi:hypothetical protein
MSKNRISEIREQMKNSKEPVQLTWENIESMGKPPRNNLKRRKFVHGLKYLRGHSEYKSPPGHVYHKEEGFLDGHTGVPLGIHYNKRDGFMNSYGFPIRLSEEKLDDLIAPAYVSGHKGGTRRLRPKRGTRRK